MGWTSHNSFGLREEWLNIYLSDRTGWRYRSNLGNRQIDSLAKWLRTTGLEGHDGCMTPLGEEFASRGTAYRPLWELLWVNVVFAFPTARWYVHLGLGAWNTTELRVLLRQAVPRLAARTINNAILEIVGFFERTPVGGVLGQGVVNRGRPRRVVRCGAQPGDAALIHCMGQLYLQEGKGKLLWTADLTWPWVVFGCSRKFVLERLIVLDQEYFKVDEEGITIHLTDEEGWRCGAIPISWL